MMLTALAPHTYNHLEPGAPGNTKIYRICGGKTRNAETQNELCQQKAGWGTNHAGVGRCKLHAGASLGGPNSPKWKGGRYSYLYRERLAAQFQAVMSSNSGNPLDLTGELEAQRVILSLALDDLLGKSKEVGHETSKGDKGGVADNNITSEISAAIPPSASASLLVSPEKVLLVRDLMNDVVNTVTRVIAARNQTALAKAEILYIQSAMKEAIEQFVPVENRRPMVKFMKDRLKGLYEEEGKE